MCLDVGILQVTDVQEKVTKQYLLLKIFGKSLSDLRFCMFILVS